MLDFILNRNKNYKEALKIEEELVQGRITIDEALNKAKSYMLSMSPITDGLIIFLLLKIKELNKKIMLLKNKENKNE